MFELLMVICFFLMLCKYWEWMMFFVDSVFLVYMFMDDFLLELLVD